MTRFKTVLEAWIKGDLTLGSLFRQCNTILEESPHLATKILAQLDESFEQNHLDNEIYVKLRKNINEFRRTHPSQTEENTEIKIDSTLLAEDSASKNKSITSLPDPTVVIEEEPSDMTKSDVTESGVDFNISATDTQVSETLIDPMTETQSHDTNIPVGGLIDDYKSDSIIKHRFKLEKVLGVGGMGKVYKALDLLKAEAKDKKPHVAIKLLNEDFRDHPEAFIALQRESSRQQKLAHPNIATIYDFDRVGGPGTPVFITMELMEGMELKDFIKKKVRPQGGLPFDEAYGIIKQLGAGLIYAHERQLVHSDFKPGNAFLCNDGTVKTLDFGIARAVKNPITGEAEKTLFDPGKLGALTPAYASLEMLQGIDPDTRDDIYPLACTAYELLTGTHPFNKLPADKAKQNNLIPPYLKTLNKKQNRALRRALAFNRENRSPNVAHFLEELQGKATWHKNPFTIAAGILFIIGLTLIGPTTNYLYQKKLESIITEIKAGDEQTVIAKLDEIKLIKKSGQAIVINEAKEKIQRYFSDLMDSAILTAEKDYNFTNVKNIVNNIKAYYPGSIYLQKKMELLDDSKKRVIGDLTSKYLKTLKNESESSINNIKQILNTIRKIDANNSLLTDTSLVNVYRLLALKKFESNDLEKALTLVNTSIDFSTSDDQQLIGLKNKIEKTLSIAKLEEKLGDVQKKLSSLTELKQYEDQIITLANLKPNSELLTELTTQFFKPAIETELNRILKDGSNRDADVLASNFGNLMNSLQLNKELTQIKLAKLTREGRKNKIKQLVAESIRNIDATLEDVQIDDFLWKISLSKEIKQLENLATEEKSIASSLEQYRKRIANLYTAKANKTLQTERFDIANDYVDLGEYFSPGLESLAKIRNAIANAKDKADRLARVEANKLPFKSLTDGNNVLEAEKIYEQFKTDLPADDLYLTTEAIPMLASAYGRLGMIKAEAQDYDQAYSFVVRGLEIHPSNIELADLKLKYELELNIAELTKLFKTAISFSKDIRLEVAQISNADPVRFAKFSDISSNILVNRIKRLQKTNENAAANLANSAARLFPENQVLADMKKQLQLKPWVQFINANAAIKEGRLTQAKQIQQEAAIEYANHPQFVQFSDSLEQRLKDVNEEFNDYLKEQETAGKDYDDLRLAKKILQRVQKKWTDNPNIAAEETRLDQLIEKAKPVPKSRIRAREVDLESIVIPDRIKKTWKPIASDSECTSRLAGYGTRARAICYDMIHPLARGPLMIVIPNNEDYKQPFAIAKYEISISDWSKYCILSGRCVPNKNKERAHEPMTGITLKEAKEYAVWLSNRTGKSYRLPTSAEWKYAANADGKQPKKDFNCRVSIGNKLIKGTGIVSVKSGKSNGWGLKNYIGNVQEWVLDADSAAALGGAYTDPLAKCDITFRRNHNGNADNITGFRLIRDDIR